MLCCRGNKLEMIYSHPNSDCYRRRSCKGSGHSNLAKGINAFTYSLQPRNDLFPSNYDRHEQLTWPDQSIPQLEVESMLYSRGNKLEMISPLLVEHLFCLFCLFLRFVLINEMIEQPPTEHRVICSVGGFFAIYSLFNSNAPIQKTAHAGKPHVNSGAISDWSTSRAHVRLMVSGTTLP
jgi:hypothetical protein